jgi:hypothetical protein
MQLSILNGNLLMGGVQSSSHIILCVLEMGVQIDLDFEAV